MRLWRGGNPVLDSALGAIGSCALGVAACYARTGPHADLILRGGWGDGKCLLALALIALIVTASPPHRPLLPALGLAAYALALFAPQLNGVGWLVLLVAVVGVAFVYAGLPLAPSAPERRRSPQLVGIWDLLPRPTRGAFRWMAVLGSALLIGGLFAPCIKGESYWSFGNSTALGDEWSFLVLAALALLLGVRSRAKGLLAAIGVLALGLVVFDAALLRHAGYPHSVLGWGWLLLVAGPVLLIGATLRDNSKAGAKPL